MCVFVSGILVSYSYYNMLSFSLPFFIFNRTYALLDITCELHLGFVHSTGQIWGGRFGADM